MGELVIREERESDWFESEYVTKKAFWNLHVPGCNEHYLVHLLRRSPDYVPELTRVAEIGGKVVGLIMYAKSRVVDGGTSHEVLTFGPLCIDPAFQKQGIGGRLLEATMALAREHGHRAIIIYGEPEYYPRFGFKTCDHFGITTHEGKNFDAFMALELVPGALEGIKGKFYEAQVYEDCNSALADVYDKKFPYMKKEKRPGQWET